MDKPITLSVKFNQRIAKVINEHFKKPYLHEPEAVLKIGRYMVNRPNHGLAHGMRQGVLAVGIIKSMLRLETWELKNNLYLMVEWLRNKVFNDVSFVQKVQLVASYQCSGRESEINRENNKELYLSYERQDERNFYDGVRYFPNLFTSTTELQKYGKALLWEGKEGDVDVLYLRRILHAAHRLDLRRINAFDNNRIIREVSEELFYPGENVLKGFWHLSGKLLLITGDRDLMFQSSYQERFGYYAHHPEELAKVVCVNV